MFYRIDYIITEEILQDFVPVSLMLKYFQTADNVDPLW